MTIFLATLTVKEDSSDDFERYCTELTELSRKHEPDLLVYELIKSENKPLTYLWYARFKDKEAFELHQTTDFHDRLVPKIFNCLANDMEIEFYDHIC